MTKKDICPVCKKTDITYGSIIWVDKPLKEFKTFSNLIKQSICFSCYYKLNGKPELAQEYQK